MPFTEVDMNAGDQQLAEAPPATAKAPVTNKLLDGACDDADNELTEAQKALIADRMAALQARFKAFEDKTNAQKVEELMFSHGDLTLAEAEMVLRVCNGNEFEAGDRLSEEEEDHVAFLQSIRGMVRDEERATKLRGNSKAAAESKLAKKQARLRKRTETAFDPDGSDSDRPEVGRCSLTPG